MHKISVTVDEACDLASIGRTTLYKLFKNGELTKRSLGGRTIILVDELRAYIAALPSV
ncbi:MAG: helix-turn-helix domain-containing protein [Hyphomicrobiales bacterium]